MTENHPCHRLRLIVQVMHAISKKKLPEEPKDMSIPMSALWGICQGCWTHNPYDRLKIQEVVSRLSSITSAVRERAVVRTVSNKREKKNSRTAFSEEETCVTRPKFEAAPNAKVNGPNGLGKLKYCIDTIRKLFVYRKKLVHTVRGKGQR